MNNKNGKFTTSQLQQLGFHLDASGAWCKDDIQTRNSKPPLAVNKRDERRPPLAADEDQASGARRVRYRLIVHSFRTVLIDPSNASMKQIEDSLSSPQGRKSYGLGIIPDDSAEYCDQPLFLQTKVKKGQERTEIEVLEYSTI